MTFTSFPPLSGAIANAESWTCYLKAPRTGVAVRPPEEIAASLDSLVSVGVHLGESLPSVWRLTFDSLLRPGQDSWTTVKNFEAIRQEVRRLLARRRFAISSGQDFSVRLWAGAR